MPLTMPSLLSRASLPTNIHNMRLEDRMQCILFLRQVLSFLCANECISRDSHDTKTDTAKLDVWINVHSA